MAGAGRQRARKERKNGNGNGNDDGSPKDSGKQSESPETQQASSSSESPPTRQSPPSGWDGNRDPSSVPSQPVTALSGPEELPRNVRNMDLGLRNSYLMHGGSAPTDLAPRPAKLNNTGRMIAVKLNTFDVRTSGMKTVHQYDVTMGSGNEKRGLILRLWKSDAVQKAIGAGWIFDGNKIAYSQKHLPEPLRVEVDLDKEKGRPPRTTSDGKEKTDTHLVRVKWAKKVPMQNLDAYLGNQTSWDSSCLEAMTFLDHLLRESPSRSLIMIKRNFFHHGQQRTLLGGGIEAMKGVYLTIRPVLSQLGRPAQLSINVDVANTTFWVARPLQLAAMDLAGANSIPTLVTMLRPSPNGPPETPAFHSLRRLRRLHVLAKYRNLDEADEYVIDKILPIRPRDKFFMARDSNGKEYRTNVQDYCVNKYGTRLSYPDLPLIKMTKGTDTCIPMELLSIKADQRYSFKLSERQTSEMIKFAVTLPSQRWSDIERGVSMLEWRTDQYLSNYGLQINPQAAVAQATLLPPPKVAFAQGSPPAEPKTSGRWDLRGKRFIEPNMLPLKSWGVCVIPGKFSANQAQVQAFLGNFIRVYEGHGGKVETKQPLIISGNNRDAGESVEKLYNATGNRYQQAPQLMVFIVPDKNSEFYNRIKKSADCRYGVVSQVLQSAHVQRNQGQYCSNVAMKVNAKLGGATSLAKGVKNGPWFTRPTMVIGADVSHGAPGGNTASIAAITVSWDRLALRYAAGVEVNGLRQEMISADNWKKVFQPIFEQWVKVIGGRNLPQHIYYLRDGVSEGQYSQVLAQELKGIQDVVAAVRGSDVVAEPAKQVKPKYTVLTCTKRHHVRFFPNQGAGDRNGNPQPGTLIEQGVTDPRDFDFYLCAHSAIKGTARPVHYTVLRDDSGMSHMDLQNMLYEGSYQYVRSTTPVSLHPAIYYAHLAALRAGSHINAPSESSREKEKKQLPQPSKTGSSEVEIKPLIPMKNTLGIRGAMWYV